MMMKSEKIGCIVTMLMALLVLSCTSDETLSSTDSLETVPVSLAMNVSTSRAATRMTAAATQQETSNYRGIQDINLIPFSEAPIGANASLSNVLNLDADLRRYETTLNYYDSESLNIPVGTRLFLCYARAVPYINQNENEKKFWNGSLTATIPNDETNKTTGDISFVPEVIHEGTAADEPFTDIADYLTALAAALKDAGKDDLYRILTTGSSSTSSLKPHAHLLACSSTNVAQLAAWVTGQGVDLSSLTAPAANYPTSLYLPEGAAVVEWNHTQNRFVPQIVTSTEANINSWNRFVYPAELYYYANSLINTSYSLLKDYYNLPWDGDAEETVLKKHENKDATILGGEASIAIQDPLCYAVGCLQVGLNVQSTLQDAAGKTITLKDGTVDNEEASFPLTAILISSQFAQGYDFTPKGTDEYIIYDKTIEGGISMGGSIVSTPTTPSKYTNTLVLQTKDNENVRFALEFENNSGEDFEGINGKVFDGTKFYLVGTIEVPAEVNQYPDYKNRVFTKNHITQGVVTIKSLKDAYTYLPDLVDPRLEVAIQLVPNWIQVTTTNVPL